MKYIKSLAVLALAVVFVAPAFAETQTVKVSGSLDVSWTYREDFDLRDGNDQALANALVGDAVRARGAAATADSQNDGADYFTSTAQVEIAADLTDNVSVVINLFNQRDWNAYVFDSGTSTANTTEEFDLGVDLAYVQLKEAWYEPLTLTIGRQDIEFGRGFIFGNFNIQDPQASIVSNEYSAVTSYDAVRSTLDFAPWTVDFVYANIAQNSSDSEDDRSIWWANINYQFAEYNAEWELYFGSDSDRSTNAAAAAAAVRSSSPEQTWVVGTRAEFDPTENLTLGAEVAYQFGDYYGTSAVATPKVDRSAWAFDLYGQYVWNENAYRPWVGLEYVFFSGNEAGTSDFEGWNGMFRSPTYGVIREYLDTLYTTALTTDSGTTGPGAASNHQHFAISGGLSPMDDLSLDATFYWFWTDEDFVTGGTSYGDEVGTELDVNITYDYTEDVTFGLGFAVFNPGDIYDQYNVVATGGSTNDTATQVTGSVGVVF